MTGFLNVLAMREMIGSNRKIIACFLFVSGGLLTGCSKANPPEIIHPFIGCWESEEGRSTEYWQHDRSGWMVGYGRSFDNDGQVSFFEHLRIETNENSERLVVSGMAAPPVAFDRVETENPHIYRFENAGHDFPQVISYEPSEGRLGRLDIGPGWQQSGRV